MAGSFALSIILFLSFSVTIEFMNHTLRPLQPWTADLSIVSGDNTCSVDRSFVDGLRENPVVDKVYGRMCIAMSVTARTKQYGAFRAIGLSNKQLSKMIAAEAFTYAAIGSMAGLCLGLLCNKFLFAMLVSSKWGDPWAIPWAKVGIILLLVLASVAFAIYRPTKKIHGMSIVETINTQ